MSIQKSVVRPESLWFSPREKSEYIFEVQLSQKLPQEKQSWNKKGNSQKPKQQQGSGADGDAQSDRKKQMH